MSVLSDIKEKLQGFATSVEDDVKEALQHVVSVIESKEAAEKAALESKINEYKAFLEQQGYSVLAKVAADIPVAPAAPVQGVVVSVGSNV